MRILVAFLFLGLSAVAQPISFGIRAGVPFTQAYADLTLVQTNGVVQTFSESTGYVIGPMVELHLPIGFSVEADALYRPIQISHTGAISAIGMNTTSWEFPVVGKYRFLHTPLVKPYVEAGPSFRHVGVGYFSNAGFVLGVGVEIKIARIRIEPELRYDRWGADASTAIAHLPTQLNQGEFLVGLTF
jgi:Outer membrane protein beta-barrel domain